VDAADVRPAAGAEARPPKTDFWAALDELVSDRRIVIDRPRDSRHPRFPATVYPLDYGYVDGTHTTDGGGLDVFVGDEPSRTATALVATVDPVKRDVELKLLVGCSSDDVRTAVGFLDEAGMNPLLVVRPSAHDR
jgi:inorganic pyrophosphatase